MGETAFVIGEEPENAPPPLVRVPVNGPVPVAAMTTFAVCPLQMDVLAEVMLPVGVGDTIT